MLQRLVCQGMVLGVLRVSTHTSCWAQELWLWMSMMQQEVPCWLVLLLMRPLGPPQGMMSQRVTCYPLCLMQSLLAYSTNSSWLGLLVRQRLV